MRWILVDRFLSFDGATAAHAVKNVSSGEDFGSAHFPGLPVFPVSLMIEALAQTGGILAARADGFRNKVILAKVERATASGFARPGDQLHLRATVVERRPEGFKITGTVTCPEPAGATADETEGRVLLEATLMFVNLGDGQAGSEVAENFVFTPEFLGQFRGVDVPAELSAGGTGA